MDNYIPEIELNFSNVCWANCFMCAKPHGAGNIPFMERPTFAALLKQLRDVRVGQYQTSGNGECLLNPDYAYYLHCLKQLHPSTPRWCYNNFSMMKPSLSYPIIQEQLLNKIHVRVESLDKDIFQTSSRLNQQLVFDNIKAFMGNNQSGNVHLTILYNNPGDYYNKCQKTLGKVPQYWPFGDRTKFPDEMEDIRNYFQAYSNQPIDIFRIGHCLWAERESAQPDGQAACPKIEIMKGIVWISPNGDVQACPYDDNQSEFTVGNILEEHILNIWHGPRREELLDKISQREIKGYPCNNPKCCGFEIENATNGRDA